MSDSKKEDERLKLIQGILGKKQVSSRLFVQYMSKDRTYGGEDTLYMREVHFLVAVGLGEGRTMSELAEELEVTHGAVSQTAGRLEKKGYIIRRRSPENRRIIIAALTEKGEQMYRDHLAYDRVKLSAMDRDYLHQFTLEELELIQRYESAMCAIFTDEDR